VGTVTTNQAGVFVQWKGTDVCLDFNCPCGYGGHFDGTFAYALRCGNCGQVYEMPHTFKLAPVKDDGGAIQDPDQDGHSPFKPAPTGPDVVEINDQDDVASGESS
jgi:hypothetical protein